MSANHPNSLWTNHKRGKHGKMSEFGPAWNRYLMEHPEADTTIYFEQFRHVAIRRARKYYRGALISL